MVLLHDGCVARTFRDHVCASEVGSELGVLLAIIFDKEFMFFFTLNRKTQGSSRFAWIRLGLGKQLRSSHLWLLSLRILGYTIE